MTEKEKEKVGEILVTIQILISISDGEIHDKEISRLHEFINCLLKKQYENAKLSQYNPVG